MTKIWQQYTLPIIENNQTRQKSFEITIFDSKLNQLYRGHLQGQLKKSLTNSTDSKKDKNQNGFWLVKTVISWAH